MSAVLRNTALFALTACLIAPLVPKMLAHDAPKAGPSPARAGVQHRVAVGSGARYRAGARRFARCHRQHRDRRKRLLRREVPHLRLVERQDFTFAPGVEVTEIELAP